MIQKNIVITGASRGIGKAIAEYLANEGHRVLALARSKNIFFEHPSIHYMSVDLTSRQDMVQIEEWVKAHFDKVDALINNAGSLINKPFAELSWEDFQQVYQVNVFAVAQLTQVLLPYMFAKSHVVCISSMGGIQGSMKFPGLAAYSSSKAAVITLSELLAEEYKSQQICFNVLALGAVQTEMLEEAFPGYQAPITSDEMAVYIGDFALKAHAYINGKVIQVSTSTP